MKILIIEDDQTTQKVLRMSLEREGFSVDTVSDGQTGSYTARVNDYDIIILDNVLPEKQGADVCRDIRAAGKSVPILMLSAKAEVLEKVALLRLGVDDYMTKPFSFEELLARIHTLLRRPAQIKEDILTLDSLRMQTRTQKVTRDKKELYLTRKEFSLLEYLLRNKDYVVSRGQILEHVWDSAVDPFSNTIEAHIMNLRKKLESHGHKRLIFNVPGRGYKISLQP